MKSTARLCGLARLCAGGLDHAHDVGLLHDEEVLAVDADLGAGPLAEQDAVADLDVERLDLAVLVARAGADGDDLALLRLLLGGVGDDDAALGLLLGLDAADHDTIMKWAELHGCLLLCGRRAGRALAGLGAFGTLC